MVRTTACCAGESASARCAARQGGDAKRSTLYARHVRPCENLLPAQGNRERNCRRVGQSARDGKCIAVTSLVVLRKPHDATLRRKGREAAGRLPTSQSLLVILLAAISLGVEDEFPGALQKERHNGEIISAETGGRLPVITVLVGALDAYLVKNDANDRPAGALRRFDSRCWKTSSTSEHSCSPRT